MNPTEGGSMSAQERSVEQVQSDIDALNARARWVSTREQSRAWALEMRALQEEMRVAAARAERGS